MSNNQYGQENQYQNQDNQYQQNQYNQPNQYAQPNQYQQNQYVQQYQQIIPQYKSGASVASLVLGIISVVSYIAWYVSLPCGIIAIFLGVKTKKEARNLGLKASKSTAGFVLGIIGVCLSAIIAILVISALSLYSSVYY